MRKMTGRKMDASRRRNILVTVLILVIFTAFYFRRQPTSIAFQFEEQSMTLSAPGGELSVCVEYNDIISIDKISQLDAGIHLSGICTDRIWFGSWRNERYGDYMLCATPTVSDYIVLETKGGFVLCNYESEDATEHLCTAMVELIETKKQGG